MPASPRPRLARLVALTVAASLAIASCSSRDGDGGDGASARTTAAPASSATSDASGTTGPGASASTTAAGPSVPAGELPAEFFAAPDPLPPGGPGTVLRSRPIAAPAGTEGHALLYTSTAVDGRPTAVSAVVFFPTVPTSGPRDVLAWAHGTTGLGDSCATSQQFATETAVELAIVTFVAQQGLVFVATDYEGLGTPGPHPYLVNRTAGRNVLDSIRAAQSFAASGATAASRSVVWGHSQGGGAAALAAELQPTYAPELQLKGAVAGAPAADLVGFTDGGTAQVAGSGFVVMALAGYAAAYPDVQLDRLLTPEGQRVVGAIGTQCNDEIQSSLSGATAASLLAPGATTDTALLARLKENSAGFVGTPVPVLLYHGDADDVVPVATSKTVLDRWCALGVNASRTVYPGADHVSVVLSAAFDISAWMQARLAGTPATSGC